ncbi:hypothetical protein BVX99_01255 [bacterium F16]|nr:hypothetical protein BVX99_01255 [bacterium F16]
MHLPVVLNAHARKAMKGEAIGVFERDVFQVHVGNNLARSLEIANPFDTDKFRQAGSFNAIVG